MKLIQLFVTVCILAVITISVRQASAQTICINNPAACSGQAPTPVVQPVPPSSGSVSPAPVVHNVFGPTEVVAKSISEYYPTQKSFEDMMNDLESMQGNYISCGSNIDGLRAKIAKLESQLRDCKASKRKRR